MSKASLFDVDIRRLWFSDAPVFRKHLLRLDPESRRRRFCGNSSDKFVDAYAAKSFGNNSLIFGAFVDGELRGAGELHSRDTIWLKGNFFKGGVRAEAALSVEPHFQGRGLGSRLFERMTRVAVHHGIETIEILCEPGNVGVTRLAQKYDVQLSFCEDCCTGKFSPVRSNPLSLARESLIDFKDLVLSMYDLQLRTLS